VPVLLARLGGADHPHTVLIGRRLRAKTGVAVDS
jgi:hypothetical protein